MEKAPLVFCSRSLPRGVSREPEERDLDRFTGRAQRGYGHLLKWANGEESVIETLSERVPLKVSEHEIVLHGSCRDCTA